MALDFAKIFEAGMDYSTYRQLIETLLAAGKTTGSDHSESMLHYTKMNIQRMNRLAQTVVLNDELLTTIAKVKGNFHFLVISEGWCGDAAQILPVFEKIISAAPEKFDLKIVLRDQNPELINQYLTNGGKAIPVLLILDENYHPVLPKWGPRPQILQQLLAGWKKESQDALLIATQLHGWYAKDKTKETQFELMRLLDQLAN